MAPLAVNDGRGSRRGVRKHVWGSGGEWGRWVGDRTAESCRQARAIPPVHCLQAAGGTRVQSHPSIVSITVSGSIIISVSEGWHGTFGGERRSWLAVRRGAVSGGVGRGAGRE